MHEKLDEFSVVFTDRATNHMSEDFINCIQQSSTILKSVYRADHLAIIPGGGTYAMEAVARQFAEDEKVLVLRNGWFSYRWTQIFEKGKIPSEEKVLMASTNSAEKHSSFSPFPVNEVVEQIDRFRPHVVFAAHVETSCGLMLPHEYLKKVARACELNGALFVVDSIASGAVFLDMRDIGIDVLISAPQKSWSSTPCAGIVMMNEKAYSIMHERDSRSFSCDLKKMDANYGAI